MNNVYNNMIRETSSSKRSIFSENFMNTLIQNMEVIAK